MRNPGINGGELRAQPANPGSPGKMAVKMECVCKTECVCHEMANYWCSPRGKWISEIYYINLLKVTQANIILQLYKILFRQYPSFILKIDQKSLNYIFLCYNIL